jgi:hypothetical protein
MTRFYAQDTISEGYSFTDTDTEVCGSFPVPDSVDPSSLFYRYDSATRSLSAVYPKHPPAICGILFADIENYRFVRRVDNLLILQESTPRQWPFLVSSASSDGIDSKFLFVLGLKDAMEGRSGDAFSKFDRAADQGFAHAQLLVAKILLRCDDSFGHSLVDSGVAPDAARSHRRFSALFRQRTHRRGPVGA